MAPIHEIEDVTPNIWTWATAAQARFAGGWFAAVTPPVVAVAPDAHRSPRSSNAPAPDATLLSTGYFAREAGREFRLAPPGNAL